MTDNLAVHPAVRSALGAKALDDLRATLLPLDCQTCGVRFTDSDQPSLAADALGGAAFAALHHQGCRPSDWRKQPESLSSSRHLTWRASTLVWPSVDLPMILANPSCEGALLRKEGLLRRRWRNSSLDRFVAGGFHQGKQQPGHPPAPLKGLEIHLDAEQVTAGCLSSGSAGGPWVWNPAIGKDFYAKARAANMVVIGVSNVLDPPNEQMTDERLRLLVAQGKIVYGVAPITRFSRAAQGLRAEEFAKEATLNGLVALTEAVRQTSGAELTADQYGAADGLCHGNPYVRRLGRPDQILALLLFSGVYAAQHGAVHLMTPDPATTREIEEVFRKPLGLLNIPLSRVSNGAPTKAHSITLGTQQEFAAHWARPSTTPGSTGFWSAAVVVDPEPDFVARDFMRRYARLAEV